ncbi:MAG: glutamine--fructose-6-phosphate transaminase (isomerizing) [Porphyromonas endodontalis]|jgi:glutamine-fructose-6-phosphate transaminase (isomerizing)|uniref:glutamine--fructose-6-phosphate transaminase (isomerizing) n=1 Tax=Porphyromonas endodontalis TaxID=28124 RepID=UPI0028E590C8|nr:glutamine--fructose-6-phosphate transaminase (isomerizing) [Porphyromonas endodontalis]
MCGIVGYTGGQEAFPILIKGLKRLEYRGYDSAGVALQHASGDIVVCKTKGKVINLESCAQGKDLSGSLGIAHTRWATHGEPSERNAHPHYSESGEIALVHNGIIENYRELKRALSAEGYTFQSDTDTEVLVQLIEYTKKKYNLSLFRAVQKALSNVIGAYAIAVIDKNEPHCLVATRKSSPLAIGVGDDNQEFFLASDPTPMIEYTRDIIFVEDGDVVELIPGKAPYMETLSNQVIEPKISNVTMDLGMIEKEGYPHFMIKEILDQPRVLGDCMRGRVSADLKEVILSAMVDHRDRLLSAERIIIVGCGTSWHAALIGKQLIESLARIPVEVEYSSEFRYRNPIIRPSDVVIAMSQSGETADTLAAIQLAKEKGAFIYGICNSVGSSIARATDSGTYIHVGPEIGVASTKAFTGQVTVLVLLALCLGREKGSLAPEHYTQIIDDLLVLPEKIEKIFEQKERIEQLSTRFTYAHNFIYLGRGINYPVALEGALKLKEISYIHAEGYPAAEMKHGPIALIDEEMPIVVIATRDKIYEKVVSNIQEIKARKGRIIAIVNEGDTQVANMVDYVIEIPEIAPELEPLLTVVPLQLLSYYIAVCKGKDVDQPRNLAKSVTVE